jgi:hypothetical protein
MAWPPAVLPINRTNATPQLDTHAADHNAVNAAVNDTVGRIQSNESALAGQLRAATLQAVQNGQTFSAGQVAVVGFTSVNDVPTWGSGPYWSVPAGCGGNWVVTVKMTAPQPPAGAVSRAVIALGGNEYSSVFIAGSSDATVTAMAHVAAGSAFYVIFDNKGAAGYIGAVLTAARVANY